jgi:hypothetical protein
MPRVRFHVDAPIARQVFAPKHGVVTQ